MAIKHIYPHSLYVIKEYVFMAFWLIIFYTFMLSIVFSIFICMKKPQDINDLKKIHYLCNRISYPKK